MNLISGYEEFYKLVGIVYFGSLCLEKLMFLIRDCVSFVCEFIE